MAESVTDTLTIRSAAKKKKKKKKKAKYLPGGVDDVPFPDDPFGADPFDIAMA